MADDVNPGAAAAAGAHKPPPIALPKGGGAIRGIGEKFGVNQATGAGSLSIGLGVSPGRSGFGPNLDLSYDSTVGNGPFGFGWSLSLPSITRKTDKGLPRYAEGSDVFILSGAEDLVPVLRADGSRESDTATAPGFTIHRYRPRVEGLFARIERWTDASGDEHWRSITRDNITTLYGQTDESRVASDRRVFQWLICASYDDRGHAIVYSYAVEDDTDVDRSLANERNREHTANRYLKRVRYGNTVSRLVQRDLSAMQWLFEVVFDYDERHYENLPLDPSQPAQAQHRFARAAAADGPRPSWAVRPDAFSVHRAGFEVRTHRRCRRILMFHRFAELGSEPCLVRSTELDYADFDYSQPFAVDDELVHQGSTRLASFIQAVVQSGYVRDDSAAIVTRDGVDYVTYLKKSLPMLELQYSKALIRDDIQELDRGSLENLPVGIDRERYALVDLDGEGVSGILTQEADAWFYKPNLGEGRFGPVQTLDTQPSLAGAPQQLLDLSGNGRLDVVDFAPSGPGFFERTEEFDWAPFHAFDQLPNVDWRDPNLHFVDVDGDGLADVLLAENEAFTWYPSLARAGFGPGLRVAQPFDEERSPQLVAGDRMQAIYLADMCGDGLADLVRIRNSEVSYWPNLGYGRFGARVAMDDAPWLDRPDQFDVRRVRIADIDGSGTSDLIYLGTDSVRLYFNQSGNRFSAARPLPQFPPIDDLASVVPADLLGTGTACLVWSTPALVDAGRPLRYIDLMGSTKPHLLVASVNNLGAETRIEYASSTTFYLADKAAGKPWVTRLPFPVHVVQRVETDDRISRNRFVSRYAYHHGYFDGVEREFRGFGRIEQLDTEELATLTATAELPDPSNVDGASIVPPVLTKTWFHTGVFVGRQHVSDFYAGLVDGLDVGEYYREPGLSDAQARELLLKDSDLPGGLSVDEQREACRALKGSMLRQEIYALDGGLDDASQERAQHPYTVTEQNFAVRRVQPQLGNRHAVFLTHRNEELAYHYERVAADPRLHHTLTLEVDAYGNVAKEASVVYGRRQPDPSLPLDADRAKQTTTLVTYTEHQHTNAIDDVAAFPDDHRTPLPADTTTYELTGYTPTGSGERFQIADFVQRAGAVTTALFDSELAYEQTPTGGRQRRAIEQLRLLYRADDLTGLLALGGLQPLALSGEDYKLAFTAGLLDQVFQRDGVALLPTPADVLGGPGADRGGYLSSQEVKADGRFPASDPDGCWWVPGGRELLSPDSADTAAQELAYARSHFFLTLRVRDPFHTAAVPTEGFTLYDAYDLLQVDSRDALGNRITVGERKPDGTIDPAVAGNDYRVLEPTRVMDRNRNRSAVAYDALGLMVGTAVMGKPEESLGDLLTGFAGDLTDDVVLDQLADPLADPNAVLGSATSRLVYDVLAYQRTSTRPDPSPAVTHTIVRETHESDLTAPAQSPAQLAFAYSDGFGREIQRKIQAEPGPLVGGGVTVSARWVGTGWTIFNNKGLVVRQYEPFFSATHQYEFGVTVGVSPILFYDPLGRVVATLHPDHSYAKVLFGPWQQISWDLNDTVLDDPRSDADVAGYTAGYFAALAAAPTWQTWYAQRQGGALGAQEQDAATKAAAHAATPTTTCFDTLGRTFLTLADNGRDPAHLSTHLLFATRVELDIEDNQRAVRDAMQQAGDPQGRIIARYTFDLLGHRIQQRSMEAGERWMLNDVEGKPIRWWDSRGHTVRTEYDRLRRSLRSYVAGADPAHPGRELLTDLTVYGEQHPTAQPLNLRGEIYLHLDQAGSVVTVGHDFKGNQLGLARRMTSATQYRGAVDWSEVDGDHAALPTDATAALDLEALDAVLEPRLEADMYSGATTYDAMDRPTTLTAPHTPAMAPNVIRPAYNAASLVERVDVNLRGATSAGDAVWTPFVTSIVYDANGRRQQIDYGNGSSIVYEYDPLTFRLVHLLTRRDAAAFPGDCPPSPAGWPGCQIQSLYYTYDPKGHITHVHDAAQQTIFYRNKRVEPSASFTYDAVYRLIEATGREHLGQAGRPMAHSASDATRVGIAWSDNDGAAMGTYTEDYLYDAVGSFLEMSHRGDDPANAGWSRTYAYDETSLIEDGTGGTASKTSGRLSATAVGGSTQRYRYDAHGNTTRMPNLGGAFPAPNMRWDHRDQLCEVDLGGGGTAYYVYDASGERVRKVWEKSASLTEERLYLSGFEIFRTSQAGEQLVRETLHVMDGKQRIALIETRTADTAGSDGAPAQLIRYQFGNQLGSVSLELDDDAQVISYEEYTPYGSTSYQAVRSQIETGKRYRFTGKERDRESGFYYYGARFYAPWLGRWMSCDPVWKENLYWYVRGDPVAQIDPDGKDDEKPGFWESVRRSDTVQFLGGVLAGTSSSFIPGGFLIAPIGTGTGVLNKPSRAFQAGYGAGEAATGISQIVGGAGGEVIGAGLDATGIGALVGVPVNVASAAVIVQGGGNTVAGVGNFIDALRRDPEPPPSQPTKAAPAPEPAPAPKPVAEPPPKAPAPTEPPAPPKPVGGSPASKVGAKRGPKVGLDGPHNQTIKKRADQLKAEGNEIIGGGKQDPPLPEKIIETPGGVKSTRRPDILYKTPAGETRAVNVGKVKADGKTAVPREAAAKADLERAGYPTDFVPYNAPTSKPPTTPKPPPVKK